MLTLHDTPDIDVYEKTYLKNSVL